MQWIALLLAVVALYLLFELRRSRSTVREQEITRVLTGILTASQLLWVFKVREWEVTDASGKMLDTMIFSGLSELPELARLVSGANPPRAVRTMAERLQELGSGSFTENLRHYRSAHPNSMIDFDEVEASLSALG